MSASIQKFLQMRFGDHRCQFVSHGANSKGFHVRAGESSYFLKRYPEDSSALGRMQREIEFTDFLIKQGIRNIPAIIDYCFESGVILFDFIEGEKLNSINHDSLITSLTFLKKINQPETPPLSEASEAAWNLNDFQQIVKRRQIQLNDFLSAHSEDDSLASFIQSELGEYIEKTIDVSLSVDLPFNQVLSPSDFGFHNVLDSKGQLIFFDFEYAGRDSGWKMLADFLAQPAYPISVAYFETVFRELAFIPIVSHREAWLYCYQLTLIKWVQIMLKPLCSFNKVNAQLDMHDQARARIMLPGSKDFAKQLKKVREYFQAIPMRLFQARSVLNTLN